jgi:hypothetical protein
VIHILISLLIIALVWWLASALGLPYVVAVIVTILAAIYLLGPGLGLYGGGGRGRRSRM